MMELAFQILLGGGMLLSTLWVVASVVSPEYPRRDRRVIWRQSDAEIRAELAARWEPLERFEGDWDPRAEDRL